MLTCEFEQILLYADNPSDFPNGPVYFGSSQPVVAAKPDNRDFTDVEANLIDTANKMVKEYRGVKFTVELSDGTLNSIPFGDKSFLNIQPIDNKREAPVLLTKDLDVLAEGEACIGYHAKDSKKYQAVLMLLPPLIDGSRNLEYMSTGETLLSECD